MLPSFAENLTKQLTVIDIVSETETKALGDIAIDKMAERILEVQSTDVDGVAGATVSSDAVKEAVNKALEQAK